MSRGSGLCKMFKRKPDTVDHLSITEVGCWFTISVFL